MSSTIFSTYRAGENRVTATIVAVLRSLSLHRIERLLGALTEQADFILVRFQNQSRRGGVGIPDAEVWSSCRILIETKTKRNAVDPQQLRRHLKRLDPATEKFRCLLVLTPDEDRPPELENFADDRLCWTSFAALNQAIDELLTDKSEVVSERESFLLRELQAMLLQEGLLGVQKDTVIVAARLAWDEYMKYQLYVCQPDRPFQQVDYMGFYKDSHILPLVPRILRRYPRVRMERDVNRGKLGEIVERLLALNLREPMAEYGVFVLSGKDDRQTTKLPGPIENDLRSESGRRIAFTQGQRYVRLENLKHVNRTSELISAEAKSRMQH